MRSSGADFGALLSFRPIALSGDDGERNRRSDMVYFLISILYLDDADAEKGN